MKRNLSLVGGTLFASVLLADSSAYAHINMIGALTSRGGDQKAIPCDGARGAGTVYTFEPGAIITLGVNEYVKHDSYYRIAFDNDGENGLKEPASIDPINPKRVEQGGSGTAKPDNPKCMTDAADKCGASDFCNTVSTTGATVLWDDIDPHLNAASTGDYTWTFQLPNVECENCTIQILQVMEDPALGFHGPFDGQGDIYHRCIDIKLKKGAGTSGPGNAPGATVKVGTPNPMYPNANRNCLAAAPAGDAGVGTPDAGGGGGSSDAGVRVDAGSTGTAGGAGGMTSGAAAGTADGGGTPGGTTVGTAGGAAGGAAGTTGAADGGAVVGGGATPGGSGAPVGGAPPATADDDGGCSVAFGAGREPTGAWVTVALALGLLLRRKRRS